MPRVTFVQPDGSRFDVEAPLGYTIMEAAVANGIAGIEAECGGACNCATCHAYVDERWRDALPAKTADEDSLLDFVERLRDDSRLTCQIRLTDTLDGVVVRLP